MKKVVTGREMKACDEYTIHKMQVPSAVLMERAALAVKEVLLEQYRNAVSVLVLCGSGNNGGDGFAVARLLLLEGMAADVYFAGKESSMTEETALQKKIFENYGGKYCRNPDFTEYTVVVDALLGIGLSRPVTGEMAELLEKLNASGKPVIAVDIPSGVSADTGAVLGNAVWADHTVTFAFLKRGQLLYPGAEHCGKVHLKEIGINGDAFPEGYPFAETYDREDLKLLPARMRRSHKGSYGKALLVGGTVNMAGAVLLAGRAAYRTGCGLVQLLSAKENRVILQTGLPEAVFSPWEEEVQGKQLFSGVSAAAIGPGLGTAERSKRLLEQVLTEWKGPVVLDADALNLLAMDIDLLQRTRNTVILTPHPGEMARLTGESVEEILKHPLQTAEAFAGKYGVICVLKDAGTVVTDGKRLYVNRSGNPGMSTGGSGDVLTGVICGLLAQRMAPFEAACMGVYLHGLAGEEAAIRQGMRGMTAGDIADAVGSILKEKQTEASGGVQ